MEGIHSHLAQYTHPNSATYGKWGLSARQAAIGAGRDVYCARRFANLSQEYIASRKVLPINPYGTWKQSMLADEDLANDVREHLQELGKFITTDKLVDYLLREDVMDKHGLDGKISVCTARRYLHELGYRFKSEKKGQFPTAMNATTSYITEKKSTSPLSRVFRIVPVSSKRTAPSSHPPFLLESDGL
ncbi:hypothetical protein B0H10DRAFT_2230190 [Mycena sp. CBHHK59/15]|nr:hypothetical protein B0H10DRAFT_2230190 [Mycena sp. CBHHK59/15]